ncbi:glycosyltransferase involved in cell wall biosynthesis [Serratia fonticola]|jgi:glycosyltransferase involved in cell wall biosynthesis|uniref:Glycosyltransferase involved in cell wall biosynthesis n=1 Tax=Serratia fonticola TaxID=47917 RepID=A0A559SZ96_SERFO|nr:glycosyltransferase family 4 protein [Serratia fonticola]TQI79830.1 glycosyltransferase involved in cell wall biosynthesis [Serratia fonticola]TQI98145.1 glycosyltransferase involved in cell wall biosynthesis [Serratia fonticola]TVZ67673.1 glycosyltransferase involved in cell wall biosynthesis [Serratia fonticola]
MKKICYFINSDWYFDLHWVERASAAKAAGYEIHVVSHFVGDEILQKLTRKGFICHNSSVSELSMNPFHFAASLFKVWQLLKKIDPDVLHCITIKPCLMGGFFARFYHKPIILGFVGLGRVFMEDKLSMNFIRLLTLQSYKHIFQNKRCLLAFEHEHDRTRLIELTQVNKQQTVVIDGAGINPEIYHYSLESHHEKPVVLFASRLLWSKGLGDLVEVKKRLALKGVDFVLNVAGISNSEDQDAIPMSQIDEWHRLGLINWLGRRNDVYNLIEASNVVALPSTYSEGIPRILLEASSVGRACIAYDVGGCQSLIIDEYTGSLVEKRNIALLAEKLEHLLTSPNKRVAMGVRSRERIENKFASSLVIDDTLKLYRRAISAGSY